MKKNILMLILILLMSLSITACDDTNQSMDESLPIKSEQQIEEPAQGTEKLEITSKPEATQGTEKPEITSKPEPTQGTEKPEITSKPVVTNV